MDDTSVAQMITNLTDQDLETFYRLLPEYISYRTAKSRFESIEMHSPFPIHLVSVSQLNQIQPNLLSYLLERKRSTASKVRVMPAKEAKRLLYKNTPVDIESLIEKFAGKRHASRTRSNDTTTSANSENILPDFAKLSLNTKPKDPKPKQTLRRSERIKQMSKKKKKGSN